MGRNFTKHDRCAIPILVSHEIAAAVPVAFFAAKKVVGRMRQPELASFLFGHLLVGAVRRAVHRRGVVRTPQRGVPPKAARSSRSYLPSLAPMYLKPVNVSTQRSPKCSAIAFCRSVVTKVLMMTPRDAFSFVSSPGRKAFSPGSRR